MFLQSCLHLGTRIICHIDPRIEGARTGNGAYSHCKAAHLMSFGEESGPRPPCLPRRESGRERGEGGGWAHSGEERREGGRKEWRDGWRERRREWGKVGEGGQEGDRRVASGGGAEALVELSQLTNLDHPTIT